MNENKSKIHPRPKVAALVAGCNEVAWLNSCFESLSQCIYPLAIYYIDGASSDGSIAFIRENYPNVYVLGQQAFRGLARANNIAAAIACADGAEYLFFLNPDTKTPPSLVSELVSFMEANPDFAIVGPAQTNYDNDSLNTWTLHNIRRGGVHEFSDWGISADFSGVDSSSATTSNILEIPCIQGAALFVRAALFREFGGFNEIYQTYFEDTDLCRRARLAGFRAALLLHLRIAHAVGGGSRSIAKRNSYRRFFNERNKYIFLWTEPALPWTTIAHLSLRWFASDGLDALWRRQRIDGIVQLLRIMFSLAKALFEILRIRRRHREFPYLPRANVNHSQFQKLHIVFCTFDNHCGIRGGGSATATHALAQILTDEGHEVSIVTRGDSRLTKRNGPLRILFRHWGNWEWWCRRLSLPRFVYEAIAELEASVHFARAVKNIHRQHPVHLIEVGESGGLLLPPSIPRIVRLHGSEYSIAAATSQTIPFWLRLRRELQRWAIRKTSALVAPSSAYAEQIGRELGIGVEQIHTLANPVSLQNTDYHPPQLPNPIPRLLFVGRIHPDKGIDTLINAYRDLRQRGRSVPLDIVGELHPDYSTSDFENFLSENKPWVRWHGHVRNMDMPEIYRCAEILIVPSRFETFSYVVYEGLAFGCAVIARSLMSLSERIKHNEVAHFFESDENGNLASAIEYLLDRPEERERLKRNAKVFLENELSDNKIRNEHLRLYHEILSTDLDRVIGNQFSGFLRQRHSDDSIGGR